MHLSSEEQKILQEICQKNNTNPEHIITLLTIEKEFSDRNLMRRKGIKLQMQELLNTWVKES